MLGYLTIAKKSLVLTLHKEGYTQLNKAEKLKINQATVSRTIQKFIKKRHLNVKKDRVELNCYLNITKNL
jgi:DNA-binding MarR family transcriptional regulator